MDLDGAVVILLLPVEGKVLFVPWIGAAAAVVVEADRSGR